MTGLSDVMLSRIVKIEIYSDDNGKIRVGSGSGIIINNDGYILTNAHVIEYDYDNEDGSYDIAKYIYVKFHGDDEDAQGIKATYIGKDHTNDIGILKIDGKEDLKFAEFGDSDNLKVGEKIAVVGNPQNLGISVSDGIVSALDRRLYTRKTPLIQVTAAINPGNSGGALVDMYGTVVGIISSKYSNSESLGFAIPINYAKPIIEDIIRYGYPSGRYRLGITSGEIYQQEMRDKYLEESSIEIPEEIMYGVAVFNIGKDFKIIESGIKKFDIITAINGKEVKALEDITDFTKTIDDKTPFDISVLRYVDGEWIKVVIQNVYLTQDKSGNY
jgi:serine protease Do